MNREAWLSECVNKLRPDFIQAGFELPEKIRVSCSWPSKSGLAAKRRRVGEAWSAENSGDNSFEVFISPVLRVPVEVAATLVHELVHTAVSLAAKHRGPFVKCAKAVGLEGPMTATTAGEELRKRLEVLTAEIGEYPHAELKHSNATPKQGTRMLLLKCPECGYQVRTTKKWIVQGVPTCPCGTVMETDGADESEESEETP